MGQRYGTVGWGIFGHAVLKSGELELLLISHIPTHSNTHLHLSNFIKYHIFPFIQNPQFIPLYLSDQGIILVRLIIPNKPVS